MKNEHEDANAITHGVGYSSPVRDRKAYDTIRSLQTAEASAGKL